MGRKLRRGQIPKQKPTHPLMEYAIHSLMFRVGSALTPTTQLVRFEVPGRAAYPVLISQTLPGESLSDACKNLTLSDQGWADWTRPFYVLSSQDLAMDCHPIPVSQDSVFCIDNDISFVEPAQKNRIFATEIHLFSSLFCLFQDRPLDKNVLIRFCDLDVNSTLHQWVKDMLHQEQLYRVCLPMMNRQRFIKKMKKIVSKRPFYYARKQ